MEAGTIYQACQGTGVVKRALSGSGVAAGDLQNNWRPVLTRDPGG